MPSAVTPRRHPYSVNSDRGFTLVEVLATIGIIALLAALLFPALATARERSRQTACLSNLRQIGVAVSQYVSDNDEQHFTFPTGFLNGVSVNKGWAGRIFPYLKVPEILHCPSDATEATHYPGFAEAAYPVSYALNMNLSLLTSSAALTAPAQTVLAIEVRDNHSLVTLPEEGGAAPLQCSPATNGVDGTILDLTHPATTNIVGTKYATGYLDNYEWTADQIITDYLEGKGRHSNGASFLAADGHTVWLQGKRVSVGGNPPTSATSQSKLGCRAFQWGRLTTPCAEGTAVGQHALTFSVL